jgi:hypothetical protein
MTFLFANLLNEGGPLFMYTTLIALIISVVLIALVLMKGDADGKKTSLVKHISLFALVWGFLGFFIGFITALDQISAVNGDIAPGVLAGGLKIGLLSPSFGIVAFLIARFGLIAITLKKK